MSAGKNSQQQNGSGSDSKAGQDVWACFHTPDAFLHLAVNRQLGVW